MWCCSTVDYKGEPAKITSASWTQESIVAEERNMIMKKAWGLRRGERHCQGLKIMNPLEKFLVWVWWWSKHLSRFSWLHDCNGWLFRAIIRFLVSVTGWLQITIYIAFGIENFCSSAFLVTIGLDMSCMVAIMACLHGISSGIGGRLVGALRYRSWNCSSWTSRFVSKYPIPN